MNMRHERQKIVFTTTYEFSPVVPKHADLVEPLWVDVGGCGTSDVPSELNASFNFSSPSWTSNLSGRMIFAGGHLHDGGTHLQLLKNGEVVCETIPTYHNFSSHMSSKEEEHIKSISTCSDFAETHPGDDWTIKAFYNTSLYAPMQRMDGSLEPVMGISLVYIAVSKSAPHEPSSSLPAASPKHCNWLFRSNIIPLAICVVLVTGLIAFWGYQNRQTLREGRIYLGSKSVKAPW